METVNESATIPNVDYVGEIETNAAATAKRILNTEKDIAKNAKLWGCTFLNATQVHGFDADDLIGKTKKAAGWNALAGKAGTRAKSVFNRWFSNARTIRENWADLPEDIRIDLLGGKRSFLSVVEKLNADARTAKKAAEAAEAAEENAEATAPEPTGKSESVLVSADTLNAMLAALEAMDGKELAQFQPQFERMQALCDKAVDAITTPEQTTGTNG